MKSLDLETNDELAQDQTAELVMETVSLVMRAIKREMRNHRPAGLSMPQFRTLRIVQRHAGASLSTVADHLGLTTASASKLVDSLVKQGLMTRTDSPEDRRVIVLETTPAGREALETAREAALGRLGDILVSLREGDRSAVVRAMEVLRAALQ